MNAQAASFEVVTTSSIASRYDSMTPRTLMKSARKALDNWTHASYELGGVLACIKQRINVDHDKEFGYENFADFVNAELKIKIGHVNNFIRVYETFTRKGINYAEVAALPFSVVLAALPVFTVENVGAMALQLEGKTYKEVVNLPEVKASKNKDKQNAAQKSVASRKASKAAPAADDAQDVTFKETPAAGHVPTLADYAALGEAITVEQLVALFESANVNKLVQAFNASGKKDYKLVKLGTPGPKKGSTKATATQKGAA